VLYQGLSSQNIEKNEKRKKAANENAKIRFNEKVANSLIFFQHFVTVLAAQFRTLIVVYTLPKHFWPFYIFTGIKN
jgi:hypothetical protein